MKTVKVSARLLTWLAVDVVHHVLMQVSRQLGQVTISERLAEVPHFVPRALGRREKQARTHRCTVAEVHKTFGTFS